MSPVVRLRPRARIDVTEIWDYIAEDSEAQADAFLERLDKTFQLLAEQPGIRVLHGARDSDAQFRPDV